MGYALLRQTSVRTHSMETVISGLLVIRTETPQIIPTYSKRNIVMEIVTKIVMEKMVRTSLLMTPWLVSGDDSSIELVFRFGGISKL